MELDMSTLAIPPREITAVDEFFAISELVIHMLTFLPTPSLITCMRVRKDLYAKIRDASEYKKALFLEPADPIAYYNPYEGRPKKDRTRPPEPRNTTPKAPPYITNIPFDNGVFSAIGTPNPYFADQDNWIQIPPNINMRFTMIAQDFLDHHDRMAQTPQGKIWNEMLVCQPPTQHVQIRFTIYFDLNNGRKEVLYFHDPDLHDNWVQRREGVRIVDVVDEMRRMIHFAERRRKGREGRIEDSQLELKCRHVVDEFCPLVQEAYNANLMRVVKQGDDLVPVWTDQRRVVREFAPPAPIQE